jgi:hypothetical protein
LLKRNAVLFVLAAFALAACGGARPAGVPAGSEVGAPTPAGAVERLMALASESEHLQMGYVFGTPQGAIAHRDPAANVTRRMRALAAVLEHDRYALQGLTPVGGRPEARLIQVELRARGRVHQVPFTVVQGPRARWFVEHIGVESITGER